MIPTLATSLTTASTREMENSIADQILDTSAANPDANAALREAVSGMTPEQRARFDAAIGRRANERRGFATEQQQQGQQQQQQRQPPLPLATAPVSAMALPPLQAVSSPIPAASAVDAANRGWFNRDLFSNTWGALGFGGGSNNAAPSGFTVDANGRAVLPAMTPITISTPATTTGRSVTSGIQQTALPTLSIIPSAMTTKATRSAAVAAASSSIESAAAAAAASSSIESARAAQVERRSSADSAILLVVSSIVTVASIASLVSLNRRKRAAASIGQSLALIAFIVLGLTGAASSASRLVKAVNRGKKKKKSTATTAAMGGISSTGRLTTSRERLSRQRR
jgi:hypothetical protein